MNKKTLVLGASTKEHRYSNIAIKRLDAYGHEIVAIGGRKGMVNGHEILTEKKAFQDIHTVTMYLSAQRQIPYYDYILSLKPKRIIFNPGSENEELAVLATQNNIEVAEACTLVLLSVNQY